MESVFVKLTNARLQGLLSCFVAFNLKIDIVKTQFRRVKRVQLECWVMDVKTNCDPDENRNVRERVHMTEQACIHIHNVSTCLKLSVGAEV